MLTALLTVLLLSLVAGGVDYLGFTGKRGGLRRGMGRGKGTLTDRKLGNTAYVASTTMETATTEEMPVTIGDEGYDDGFLSQEKLTDGIEAGGDVLPGVRVDLPGSDAMTGTKQGLGFRDMIDYALGWRGGKK